MEQIMEKFAGMIAPIKITVTRKLEKGSEYVNKGVDFAVNGLWDMAIKSWKEGLKVEPTNPAIYYNLGVAYEKMGDFISAGEMYKKAVELNPKKLYMEALKRVNTILQKSL